MKTLLFLLICYGACNNLIFGSIFTGFRNSLAKLGEGPYTIHKLFTCMMCLSTWMGFVMSAILIYSGNEALLPFYLENDILLIFLHGLLATGGVWLIHTFQEAAESLNNK